MKKRFVSCILILFVGALIIFGIFQLIPYGKDHTNPPVVLEPSWDSPATRAIAQKACFDCHSNETHYPWYASVAPASWLLQKDIDEARAAFNFSDWKTASQADKAEDIINVVRRGEMPPAQYLLMHPEARLSAEEKDKFISGITASMSK